MFCSAYMLGRKVPSNNSVEFIGKFYTRIIPKADITMIITKNN